MNRRWTPLQIAVWLLALLVVIALGILVATNLVGTWALLIGNGIAVVVGLLAYRAETQRANRHVESRRVR